jgi:hypothetical protein
MDTPSLSFLISGWMLVGPPAVVVAVWVLALCYFRTHAHGDRNFAMRYNFAHAVDVAKEGLKVLYLVNTGAVAGIILLARTDEFLRCGDAQGVLIVAALSFACATLGALLAYVFLYQFLMEQCGVRHWLPHSGGWTWVAVYSAIGYGALGVWLTYSAEQRLGETISITC